MIFIGNPSAPIAKRRTQDYAGLTLYYRLVTKALLVLANEIRDLDFVFK
jgi:hypothetical protein